MLKKNMGKAHFGSKRPMAYGAEGEEDQSSKETQTTEITTDQLLQRPDVKQAFQAMLDQEVSGLKKKNSELIDKFKRFKVEPDELEKILENQKKFEGLDVERLSQLQKQVEENEEMKLLSEGKVEEVVTKRVELLKKDHEHQINAVQTKLSELEGLLAKKEENLRELKVDGTIQKAYGELDFEPAAMDFVVRSAREVFIMDENGNVSPRDAKGNIIFSKDGTTPIDAKGWLELQAESKPFLRKPSSGGGASGGGGINSSTGYYQSDSAVGKIASGLEKMLK